VVSAIFLIPVLAGAASEYDFSLFFGVLFPECQITRMSKIENGRLDQYGKV